MRNVKEKKKVRSDGMIVKGPCFALHTELLCVGKTDNSKKKKKA